MTLAEPDARSWEIAQRLPPGLCHVVEVGTWRGIMAEMLLMKHPGLVLTVVDDWAPTEMRPKAYVATGDYHAQLTLEEQRKFKSETEAKLRPFGNRARIIARPSVEAALEIADVSQDGVFIDADHSKTGVEKDISAWWPKVKLGGWLGFHDYDNPDPRFEFGVTEAVDEFAARIGVEIKRGANMTAFVYL